MTKIATFTALAAGALLLTACGSADDASVEASADTVEMPADSALAPVSDAPVADPSATATDAPVAVPTATAEQAGDAAATTVDDVLEAAGEDAPSE
jgi:hypothetical protein